MHRHKRPFAVSHCPPCSAPRRRDHSGEPNKQQKGTPQLGRVPSRLLPPSPRRGGGAGGGGPGRRGPPSSAPARFGQAQHRPGFAGRAVPSPGTPKPTKRGGNGGREDGPPASPLPRPAPPLAWPLPSPRGGRYKPLFPTAVATGLPPSELLPPGPSWRGPSGGGRSPWEPPPGLGVLGRALFRGGSHPQPALILGGPSSARPARLSRAGPPAAAGTRRQPPPRDGATMRRRLCPSASSGPQRRARLAGRPLSGRRGRSGGAGAEPRPARGAGGCRHRRSQQNGSPPASPLSPWRPRSSPAGSCRVGRKAVRRALRRRAAVVAAAGAGPGGAMEGGGNSKGTGLGGLFGTGGVGYSHADLAGVPREYRRAGASGGARVAGLGGGGGSIRFPSAGPGRAGRPVQARGWRGRSRKSTRRG